MISYLLAGPAQEPVALADARAFLKLDDTAEDALLQALITAARLHVEAVTARAMLHQSWRLVRDAWPATRTLALPVTPVSALSAVTVFDADDEPQALDHDAFLLQAGQLLLPRDIAVAARPQLGIEIDYVAGYGSDPAQVPADLKHACLVLLAYWFEHRDAVSVAGAPAGFDRLVAPYRQVML